MQQKKYLYKRTLIVTHVTAIANAPGEGIDRVEYDIVGHVPTERNLKRIAEKKAPGKTILSIAKTETQRKLYGIMPDSFIEAADELDFQTGKILRKGCV